MPTKQLDLAQARSFIASVQLPPPPKHAVLARAGSEFALRSAQPAHTPTMGSPGAGVAAAPAAAGAAENADAAFDAAKNQAQVVGSALLSFEVGLDAIVREAISDSALLAQLQANHQIDFAADPQKWFASYAKVLQNVGWTVQDDGWTTADISGTNVQVNQQIKAVLAVALGPASTALAIIAASIDALQSADPSSPWVTLFDRQTHKANITRFQVGLVDKDATGGIAVAMAFCILDNVQQTTQVLFFKWKEANAKLQANGQKYSINRDALVSLGPDIRAKTRAYQLDYLSSIQDLTPHA